MNDRLTVILRTCATVRCFHPQCARPYDMEKADILRASFGSLWRSLRNSQMHWRLYVVDDSSPTALCNWMKKYQGGKDRTLPLVVEQHKALGNGKSLARQFALFDELKLPDDSWVYFAEDDYLYSGDCFWTIRDFLDHTTGDLYVSPYCQPLGMWHAVECRQNGPQVIRPGLLSMAEVQSKEKPRLWIRTPLHDWMQVFHTNWTFLTSVKMVRRHWETYQKALAKWDDKTISTIYGHAPCWTPIPALATHFQEACESPSFNSAIVREWVQGQCK